MRRKPLGTIVVAVTVLALGGCGGGDGGGGDLSTDIEVTGTDALEFEPDDFEVPAGEEVTVELTADSGVEHDVTIEGVDGEDLEVVAADAGETATGTFTIDEADSYTFYCSVPGHREAGMEGSLEVG